MEEKRLMASKISDATPQETPKVENVGEAFISWAEKYWGFEKRFTMVETDPNAESCPYKHIRDIFIREINELSKNQK